VTIGGGSDQMFVDYARLDDPNDPTFAFFGYIGNGRAADQTMEGFLFPADPQSNAVKVYVVGSAVTGVEIL
jgi:hypothetical protein